MQETADFIMGHVQATTIAYQASALQVGPAVFAVVAGIAPGCWQQAGFFVVAYGFSAAVCRTCQFTYFHDGSLCLIKLYLNIAQDYQLRVIIIWSTCFQCRRLFEGRSFHGSTMLAIVDAYRSGLLARRHWAKNIAAGLIV